MHGLGIINLELQGMQATSSVKKCCHDVPCAIVLVKYETIRGQGQHARIQNHYRPQHNQERGPLAGILPDYRITIVTWRFDDMVI